MTTDTDVLRGALTGCYRAGYQRRIEGGPDAVLFPPLDKQGRWLYMNGVNAAAATETCWRCDGAGLTVSSWGETYYCEPCNSSGSVVRLENGNCRPAPRF